MAKRNNGGPLSGLITQYIDYRRSLGFKMRDCEMRLRPLDELAKQLGIPTGGISRELAEEFCKKRPMESDTSRKSRVCLLRNFSAYLRSLGYESAIPNLPKAKSSSTPHIYTSTEVSAIFRECDRMSVGRNMMYSMKNIMPVLIRVLYGTGIRIGEAAKLTHDDVDLDNGFLKLKVTKNGDERIVPLSLSLLEVCKDYVAYKESIGLPVCKTALFFTSPDGTRAIKITTIHTLFRIVLTKAGISHGGINNGPRIHDLRHTFCINALVKMSESGQDLYHSMPTLMAYMGHKSIESTNKYLRITQEMFPNILKKMNAVYKHIFPEIELDLTTERNETN